jgi:hypothetical protein
MICDPEDSQEWLSYIESVTILLLIQWTIMFGIYPTGTPVGERFSSRGDFTVLYLAMSSHGSSGSVVRQQVETLSRLIGLWIWHAQGLFG